MTERQGRTLARFLVATMVAGMLSERLFYHAAVQAADATQFVSMSSLDIPQVDALFGFMVQRMQATTWKVVSFTGWALCLAAILMLGMRGRIARTTLALAAATFSIMNLGVVAPVAVGLLALTGVDPGFTPTPAGYDLASFLAEVQDGLPTTGLVQLVSAGAPAYAILVAVAHEGIRLLLLGAAAWLAWSSWATGPEGARTDARVA